MRPAELTIRRSAQRLVRARQGHKAVLVTGFAPFGGARVNTSAAIVERLDGLRCGGSALVGVLLPCAFGDAIAELTHALRILRPAMVVALGEADRRALTPECFAANLDDARIPDNRGRQPRNTPVVAGAPPRYASGLPVAAIVAALRRRRIVAEASRSAGSYVCNHVFFGMMHSLAARPRWPRPRAGFIHVPAFRGTARMGVGRQADAIVLAIRTSLHRGNRHPL